MNTQWRTFLEQQGANIDTDYVSGFNQGADIHAVKDNMVMADLSHFGLIEVSGEDAMDFLQNQFSNDIKEVSTTHSQLSAYCNPKGRMLASFRIFKREQNYFLELSSDLLEPTLKRLRMFVLRSKVNLEDASDRFARIGLAGQGVESLLKSHFNNTPNKINESCNENECTLIRLAGETQRFEIHGPSATLSDLWREWQSQAQAVGRETWDWFDTHSGIPVINQRTVEAFVPQMVNFSTIGGVSFTKGCYPGQEVVARMHYLGKLKRRMYLAHVDHNKFPVSGTELYIQNTDQTTEQAQSCGKIVQAQPSPKGGYDLLAVIQIAHVNEPIKLGSSDGPQLTINDDPYPVSNEA